MDVAGNDVHEAVTQARFARRYERLWPGCLDFQVVKDHLRERTDRGVAHRDVSIEGLPGAWEDHAFEKRGTGAHKPSDDQQYDEDAQQPSGDAKPAPARSWRGRAYCCISHRISSDEWSPGAPRPFPAVRFSRCASREQYSAEIASVTQLLFGRTRSAGAAPEALAANRNYADV